MTKEFLRGMTAGVSGRDGDGAGICIFSFQTVINTGISCSIMLEYTIKAKRNDWQIICQPFIVH